VETFGGFPPSRPASPNQRRDADSVVVVVGSVGSTLRRRPWKSQSMKRRSDQHLLFRFPRERPRLLNQMLPGRGWGTSCASRGRERRPRWPPGGLRVWPLLDGQGAAAVSSRLKWEALIARSWSHSGWKVPSGARCACRGPAGLGPHFSGGRATGSREPKRGIKLACRLCA
jgi:hypothetical protein